MEAKDKANDAQSPVTARTSPIQPTVIPTAEPRQTKVSKPSRSLNKRGKIIHRPVFIFGNKLQ